MKRLANKGARSAVCVCDAMRCLVNSH